MAKDKRRNNEKRKEKSRDAARCRRGKESEIFLELADVLPMAESVSGQLDKASVMRLSISVLKIHNILHAGQAKDDEKESKKNSQEEKLDSLQQRALEGFAFILSEEGDIIYLSESVSRYIGLQQIELMGQSIYEFTHPCDHDEIKEMLTKKPSPAPAVTVKSEHKEGEGATVAADTTYEPRSFFLRMKCTLTSKGRNVNLKSASYKVVKCSGRLVSPKEEGVGEDLGLGLKPYLLGVAEPIPHPANIEVPLDSKTFLSQHNMDMRYIFCEDRITELAGYNPDNMMSQTFYDFHHALDSDMIDKAFRNLFSKGQTVTSPYRMLACQGGYLWVVTQATVINNSRTEKPHLVVCVHHVLSGIEEKDLILSHIQSPPEITITPSITTLLPPKAELNTENIFAPKTKDMDQAYFVPPEMRETVKYLNNEPADLSYLAPNAGDDSVPLSAIAFWRDGVLQSPPGSDLCVMKQEPGTGNSSPDMSTPHTDGSPGCAHLSDASSGITSPNYSVSVELPEEVEAMDKFFQSIKTTEEYQALEDIDFEMRAPYIPMNADDDLGLFPPSSSVLFNFSNDLNPGLFGRTESVFGSKQSLFEPEAPKLSVKDMIGGSTAVASIEQPPSTMYMQMKRALDMNSLEKGPPKAKAARMERAAVSPVGPSSVGCHGGQQSGQSGNPISASKDSVLLNLLLRGEDRNYGYRVSSNASLGISPLPQHKQSGEVLLSDVLPRLTTHDFEVNAPAPASSTNLLHGNELLRALDVMTGKGGDNLRPGQHRYEII